MLHPIVQMKMMGMWLNQEQSPLEYELQGNLAALMGSESPSGLEPMLSGGFLNKRQLL